ncbi:glycosyltransferase [Leptolyngbya sp. GB1-A1]|uniref:glycosyltransferase family 2 protein n=1 Tax=Leptolyngbya sp. GB1-A1 TaxID=2933908 RepID=UPI0032984511
MKRNLRISVITPSYNQCQFIEATIRSVISQEYPNLEYIIIDGGSTDGSLEVIKKYDSYITYWVSEADRGQSHAINKGFEKATGDILCWINSDDMLKPGALNFVAQALSESSNASWLVGASELIDSEGSLISVRDPGSITHQAMLNWFDNWFPQQSTFWTRRMWEVSGPLNEKLYYAMDYALWLKMNNQNPPITTKQVLSSYRFHNDAKCSTNYSAIGKEIIQTLQYHLNHSSPSNELTRMAKKSISTIGITLAYKDAQEQRYSQARELLTYCLQTSSKDLRLIVLYIKLLLKEWNFK